MAKPAIIDRKTTVRWPTTMSSTARVDVETIIGWARDMKNNPAHQERLAVVQNIISLDGVDPAINDESLRRDVGEMRDALHQIEASFTPTPIQFRA